MEISAGHGYFYNLGRGRKSLGQGLDLLKQGQLVSGFLENAPSQQIMSGSSNLSSGDAHKYFGRKTNPGQKNTFVNETSFRPNLDTMVRLRGGLIPLVYDRKCDSEERYHL